MTNREKTYLEDEQERGRQVMATERRERQKSKETDSYKTTIQERDEDREEKQASESCKRVV